MEFGILLGWILVYVCTDVTNSFILTGNVGIERCPHNLRYTPHLYPYRNWCFEFHIGDGVYWDVASENCKKNGGHLVEISDGHIQSFIMYALRYGVQYDKDFLWIGLNDQDKEHTWKWDGGNSLRGYTNWADGEDNDNILHWSQDCVLLKYTDNGRWYDNACHFWPEYWDYICQYDMLPMPPTHPPKTTLRHTPSTTTTTSTSTTTRPPPTTTRTTTTTTTTTTTPTSVSTPVKLISTTQHLKTTTTFGCDSVDCVHSCPSGYSGLFIGEDGCIGCKCNN